MRNMTFISLLSLLLPVSAATAQSFHSGGVGSCNGCHVIHSSTSGPTQVLLQASDPSSICLNCHAGSGGSNSISVLSQDGSALSPGGDFYWLTRNYSWTGGQSPGYRHGHNVAALDYNLSSDPVRIKAPGGSYPSARLGCTSCHDPHGRSASGPALAGSGSYGDVTPPGAALGTYRLLGDVGYEAGGSSFGYSFNQPAPVARQSSTARYGENDASHVDYGSGMSAWCGNCHAGLVNNNHMTGSSSFRHPSDANQLLTPAVIDIYNAYVKSNDLSGAIDSAYLQFVPFERGVSDASQLDPVSRRGPGAGAKVMCLSCHRAHASAFGHSGRWDFTAELLADSHPAPADSGATSNDVINSYYGRDISMEFGTNQGQFCEKCHGGQLP
ncbi:MAG: cytochrome C [Desulfobulbaceae bacterium]|nr:MAG: cytochrome C [Desulfobulbaceae bacterium]